VNMEENGRCAASQTPGHEASPSAVPASQGRVPNANERAAMVARMDEYYSAMLRTKGLIPFRWMMSPAALQLLSGGGERPAIYRGVRIEEHDEWSWGWMLRSHDGRFIDLPASAAGTGTAETASPAPGEACQSGPQGDAR
jgi:hypothetical protein